MLKSEWPIQIPFLTIFDTTTTMFSLRYDIINLKLEIVLKSYSEIINYILLT